MQRTDVPGTQLCARKNLLTRVRAGVGYRSWSELTPSSQSWRISRVRVVSSNCIVFGATNSKLVKVARYQVVLDRVPACDPRWTSGSGP